MSGLLLYTEATCSAVSKGSENSRFALGQTEAGRYLKVVHAPRKDGPGIFVITAYELRGKELKAYRRRRRRKSS